MRMPADQLDDTLAWRKSTRSGSNGGDCVEVARLADGRVVIRNSNHPEDGGTAFTPSEWDAFLGGARDGDFDTL